MAEQLKKSRTAILAKGLAYDPKKYEYKEDFVPWNGTNPLEVHTSGELIEAIKKYPDTVKVDARILGTNSNGKTLIKCTERELLEFSKKRESAKMREAYDTFLYDDAIVPSSNVGQDFVPIMGGPFFKQLYSRDYLRMHSAAFYAKNHDPIANAIINIITEFTIARGYKMIIKNKKAEVLWKAFEKVNKIPQMMDGFSDEISIYGEQMIWWLPNHETKIVYRPIVTDTIPIGAIPRVRCVDPSNFIEIVTHPEDISRVLFYQWLAPTQYQIYTDGKQPGTKFIYQQIPADQIMHYKINSVSNEKRGRSEYFSALGYMKRLRDSIDYNVISDQKAAAWSIDTTIDGNDQDISDYVSAQQELGTIPAAGSEFVHTKAVQRQYLGNQSRAKGESATFSWCLSMICSAVRIPTSYLGTHLSGGQTRASALVATEPVAKRFERRQTLYRQVLTDMFDRLMREFGINAECEVVFPELISQDSSAKIKDIQFANSAGYISHERASQMIAKELDIDNFVYDEELKKIDKEGSQFMAPPTQTNPLTTPPNVEPNGITSTQKKDIKDQLSQ